MMNDVLVREITIQDDDRGLTFEVEAHFTTDGCGSVYCHKAVPFAASVRMPVTTHKERVESGDRFEECQFELPKGGFFQKRFLQDYCDTIECVLTEQLETELAGARSYRGR